MTTTRPVALVTGASSGIGKEAALALVKAGFDVVGTSRDTSRVAPLEGVTFLDLDVASDTSAAATVQQVIERFGRIDVLVNNAGIGSMDAAEEMLDRAGPSGLQHQRLRGHAHGEGGPAAHASPGTRAHHQPLVRTGVHPRPLHGRLRRFQACDRGLLPVPGPRGPAVRHPGAAGRARLHQHRIRGQQHAARHTAAGLRPAAGDLRPHDGDGRQGRRRPRHHRQSHRRGSNRPETEAAQHRRHLWPDAPASLRFVPARAFDRQIRKLNQLAG